MSNRGITMQHYRVRIKRIQTVVDYAEITVSAQNEVLAMDAVDAAYDKDADAIEFGAESLEDCQNEYTVVEINVQ
jgi:hypothetical protein